jgi:hypothetical protein
VVGIAGQPVSIVFALPSMEVTGGEPRRLFGAGETPRHFGVTATLSASCLCGTHAARIAGGNKPRVGWVFAGEPVGAFKGNL